MRTRTVLASLLFVAACGDDPVVAGTDTGRTNTADAARADANVETDAESDATTTDTSEADAGETDTSEDVADAFVGADATPVEIGNECVAFSYVADEAYRAADIIWVIDTSESMNDEIDAVRANINRFADSILGSGIDLSVVMVASKERKEVPTEAPFPLPIPLPPTVYLGVCVPSPLSAANACPDYDNPPVFMHPDIDVYSTDALERLMVDAYPLFRLSLRPRARTHVVVVSDDASGKDANWFREQIRNAASPGFSEDWVFHSIVGLGGCGEGSPSVYEQLSRDTGGVIQSVCQSDWTPIFDALLSGVVNDAEIPCAFGLPTPEDGLELNPAQVNVFHTPPGGEAGLVVNVASAEDCSEVNGGWYYDNPLDPSSVFICPGLCGAGVQGTVELAFGCNTVKE